MARRSRWLLTCAVWLWLSDVAGAGTAEVRLVLEVPDPAAVATEATLTLRPVFLPAGADEPAADKTVTTEAPGVASFDLPTGSAWRLSVEAEPYWSAEKVFTVVAGEAGRQEVGLRLLEAGFLTGRIVLPRDQQLPTEITARFEAAPGSEHPIDQDTVVCPVRADRWRCKLPAGELDLRLRARGFVSHYRWGVVVRPRDASDLGLIRLVRGASVVGWLDPPPDPTFDFSDCRVDLLPSLAAPSYDAVDRERRKALVAEEQINDRGFFELAGVSPGSYRLRVSHSHYAPTTRAPVEVLPDAETEIRGLELHPFSTVAVSVEPSVGPGGSPWRLRLFRSSPVPGHRDEVAEGLTGDDGRWVSGGVEPGRYAVHVLDRYGSRWHAEPFDLEPGTEALPIEVRLRLTRVRGQVLFDDEPLRALLYFGGKHRVPSIVAKSDPDGLFELVVPAREVWTIDVVSPHPRINSRLNEVPVPAGDDPWLDLVVPNLRVDGRVIDETGSPLPGTWVEAGSAGQPSGAIRSETPDGRFHFEGLDEGEWVFEAWQTRDGERWSSGLHWTALREGAEPPSLDLVLRRGTKVSGQVLSPSGQPVVGAMVLGVVEQETLSLTNTVLEATTDVDGLFDLPAPPGAGIVQLTVMAPGFALHQVRADARDPSPVIVVVEQTGGTLVLRYDPSSESYQGIRLFHDALLVWPFLRRWALANGVRDAMPGRAVFPQMPPGPYSACLLPEPGPYLTSRPPDGDLPGCVEGLLAPFGQLDLALPTGADSAAEDQHAPTAAVRTNLE